MLGTEKVYNGNKFATRRRNHRLKLLVVNADDFGITEGVNRAVLQAHQEGILTSTTLMANMPAFEHAVQLASGQPGLGVGLHLNLTAGPPVLPSSRVPTLVSGGGQFPGGGAMMRRLSLGKVDRGQVEAEMGAQLERALRAGVAITHLDSHHHLHLYPLLQPVAVRVARRYGIRGIRSTVELTRGEALRHAGALVRNRRPRQLPEPSRGEEAERTAPGEGLRESPRGVYLKTVALSVLGIMMRVRACRAGLVTPAHFRGLMLGDAFDPGALRAVLQRLPEGTTELMCHPGYPDEHLRSQTSYSKGRDRELRSLTDPGNRTALEGGRVELGCYSDFSL